MSHQKSSKTSNNAATLLNKNPTFNSQQTQQNFKWSQCSLCGFIITKQHVDDHLCISVNEELSTNEYLNLLVKKQEFFLCANFGYLKLIEHSKGNFNHIISALPDLL